MVNPLELLPTKIIFAKAHLDAARLVEVLVDGDYDGEYFSRIKWRIDKMGYVVLGSPEDKVHFGGRIYLHHFILPPKKGYWRCHLNNNKLDNRSANIAYMTPSARMHLRDEMAWADHMDKYYNKIRSLREAQ